MTQSAEIGRGCRASPHVDYAGEAYRHRIYQAPTTAKEPARARPRATTAKDTRTSRARFSWIDMTSFLLGIRRPGEPIAVSDVDDV